jgi:EpsI family protein
MQKITIRYQILLIIFIIFSGFTLYIDFHHEKSISPVNIAACIPMDFNGWKGEEINIDRNSEDFSEVGSALLRKYTKDDCEVRLFIVYYGGNSRIALSSPEHYYTGPSSYITKIGLVTLFLKDQLPFAANKLLVKGNKGKLLVLYYFETANIKTYSYEAMRWNIILNRLKSEYHGSVFISCSSVVKVNQNETLRVLKDFIEKIGPFISNSLI